MKHLEIKAAKIHQVTSFFCNSGFGFGNNDTSLDFLMFSNVKFALEGV